MKKVLLLTAALACSACQWPGFLGPGPVLTGARVTVADRAGSPIAGVKVTFNDWTSSGSEFTVSGNTNTEGQVYFAFRDPGERKCEIQLPAGFLALDGVTQTVVIEGAKTAVVHFRLIRAPSAP